MLFTGKWFLIKGNNSETARWERSLGQDVGEGQSLHASSEQGTPQLSFSLTQKFSKLCAFGIFLEASSHRHNQLNLGPLGIHSTSSPPCLPQGLASLDAFQSHLICIKRTHTLSSSRKCHKFQVVPEMRTKTKYLFLIINHDFTAVYEVLQGGGHTPCLHMVYGCFHDSCSVITELFSCDRPKIFPIWAFTEKKKKIADPWSLVSDSQHRCIIESPTIGSSYF